MKRGFLYFNQEWCTGLGTVLDSENPCSGDIIWSGKCASNKQVNAAFASARQGFYRWSTCDIDIRIATLRRYQQRLLEREDTLADAICREVGKPRWEAKTEVASMMAKLDVSISSYCERTPSTEGESTLLTHRPHGVIAVLGPYNFPAHLPNGHIVPALLAGNSIVLKPSEYTPLVAQLMTECLVEAGFPNGVINLLQGGREVGVRVSQHPELDGLFFTGSSRTGEVLHRQFAGFPHKMLALEMGGNNPLIAMDCEDERAAIYNIIMSAYITAGQRCTCARRLILVGGLSQKPFVQRLIDAIAKINVGFPDTQATPFMGPVIANSVADKLLASQEQLAQSGAELLLPMQRIIKDKPLLTPGLVDVTNIKNKADEELFGPLLQIIRVNTLSEAIDEANATRFGLAAGILTDNDKAWQTFYRRARAGIVNRNRPLTGASGRAPFGGIGASGNHRPSAYYAADYCAYPMASLVDSAVGMPDTLPEGVNL